MDNFDIELSAAKGQGTPVWDKERLGKFTASKFGDMMGTGRKKEDRFSGTCLTYIHSLIAEILSDAPHVNFGNAIAHGMENEDIARQRFTQETGLEIDPIGFIKYNDYSGGSPDGLIGDDGIVEIKCPYTPANHVKVLLTKQVYEDNHMWQIQGNLMITGRKYCHYICFDPRVVEESLQLVHFRIERDEEMISQIRERLKEVKGKLDELMKEIIHNK